MDIVRTIIDQLSGDTMRKLSSLIDAGEDTTSDAVRAAVPALLSGLGSLAAREDGAKKLTNVLNQVGSSGEDYASMLGGDANAIASKGTTWLNSLFGENTLSGVIGALGKYASLDSATVKRLLAFLAPMVLGKVGALWQARGGTTQALTNLFAEQRENIASSLPTGFSLPDVPAWLGPKTTGYADAGSRRAASHPAPATTSVASWAVPLALALLAAFVIWALMRGRGRNVAETNANRTATSTEREVTTMKPVTPSLDAAAATTELRDLYGSAEKVMASIKDAASAEAARPQLEALGAKIDALQKTIRQLPEAGQTAVKKVADQQLDGFRRQAETAMEAPGLSADIRNLIQAILQKLADLFLPASTR